MLLRLNSSFIIVELGCGSRLLELCAQMRDDIIDEEGVKILCRRYISKQSNVTFPHEIIIRGEIITLCCQPNDVLAQLNL